MDEYLAYRLKWRDAPNVRAGNVVVEFFVEVNGSITGARVLKGLSASQDRQVLSAIEKMPPLRYSDNAILPPGNRGGLLSPPSAIVPLQLKISYFLLLTSLRCVRAETTP